MSTLTAAASSMPVDHGGPWDRAHLAQAVQAMSLATWSAGRVFEGLWAPAWRALLHMETDVSLAWLRALGNPAEAASVAETLAARVAAGAGYDTLIRTRGRELFGSARWPGEQRLAEDAFFRLTYIPPAAGVAPTETALFHMGGVLPYGDPFFRLLPEANLFGRFVERGLGVYAMELKGDATTLDYRGLTLHEVIAAVSRHSATAAAHHGGRRLVLEGYCGLGSQALAYAVARPVEAAARFAALALFVAPVDGTRCEVLAESVQLVPEACMLASYAVSELCDGYVSGDRVRLSQDLALRSLFLKTSLGGFAAGWQHPEYAALNERAELTPEQRRAFAGAFWISPENGRRFPVPLDLSRYSGALFARGIAPDGTLPFAEEGRSLSLQALRASGLRVVGFYGGRDVMVPGATAACLQEHLGDRYEHVVHPAAGHVTYVMSPRAWVPGAPGALDPNPVDVILRLAATAPEPPDRATAPSPAAAPPPAAGAPVAAPAAPASPAPAHDSAARRPRNRRRPQ